MEQKPPNTTPSSRHWCQCWGTPESWGTSFAAPALSSCCVRSCGCLHGNGVRSVAHVAVYTWTAVGLPQIKMVMKYLSWGALEFPDSRHEVPTFEIPKRGCLIWGAGAEGVLSAAVQ